LLFSSVSHDVPVWKFERDGAYSVKTDYKDILNHDVAVVQHRVLGNWNRIWSLKLPLKVKNFLWRACCNCLLTRIRLQSKWVQCTDRCAVCDDFGEDCTHMFFCDKSKICWQWSGLLSLLMAAEWIKAIFKADWSQLSIEPWPNIEKYVDNHIDVLRFCSVCESFRSSIPP